MKSLEKICNYFLKYSLLVIFLFLVPISFFFTQRCGKETLGEIVNFVPIYNIPDNLLPHLAGLAFTALLFLAVIRFRPVFSPVAVKIFQTTISCLTGILGFLILNGGTRTPNADQIQVYNAALCFNENNFINLSPGGYIEMYPQQLGYVLYLQLLLKLFPDAGFRIIQLVNCLFIAGTVFFACLLLNDFTQNRAVQIIGTLFWPFFLPLALLSSWVYGDIPFFCLAFAAIHFFILSWRTEKKSYFFLTAAATALSILFRKNTLILLLAMAIVALVCVIVKKKYRILPYVLLICLCPLCVSTLVEKHYETVSEYEIHGIPSIAWIAMGSLERGSTPGWFNNFSVPLYYSLGYDSEQTASAAKQTLQEQVHYFAENPGYAASFLKRKICTQWNDPYFNTNSLISVDEGIEPNGLSAWLEKYQDSLLVFLSVFQNMIYLGALLYVCFFTSKTPFSRHILEVMILGGFLFSLIWEANSRYVMIYFLLMFPMAACGYEALAEKLLHKTS